MNTSPDVLKIHAIATTIQADPCDLDAAPHTATFSMLPTCPEEFQNSKEVSK